MPYFPLQPEDASNAVSPLNAKIAGNLADAYSAGIYGNKNFQVPILEAFLVPDRVGTVFGDLAAAAWHIKDGDEIFVLFYDLASKEVNGYKTQVRVTNLFINRFAVFLNWKLTAKYFTITTMPGTESLTGKLKPAGPLNNCVAVDYP